MTVTMTEQDQLRVCGGDCGRITRPSRWKAAQYPDTVPRADATHCGVCKRRRDGDPPQRQKTKVTPEQLESTRRHLDGWLARMKHDAHRVRTGTATKF